MPLPQKYESTLMMWNKLIRQHDSLAAELSWDGFNDFALTAFHLYDWVTVDPIASVAAKADANTLRNTLELQACRDAANTRKHRKPIKYQPKTSDTDVDQGYGVARFGKGGYGVGEEQVTIRMVDGTVFDGLDLADRVFKLWDAYFKTYPLLLRV